MNVTALEDVSCDHTGTSQPMDSAHELKEETEWKYVAVIYPRVCRT